MGRVCKCVLTLQYSVDETRSDVGVDLSSLVAMSVSTSISSSVDHFEFCLQTVIAFSFSSVDMWHGSRET